MAERFARVLVKLRWWVIGFWVAAVLGSLFVFPSLSSGGSTASLRGLVPDDTPAVTAELRSVEIFGFPLMGRTVLVQRDPDGISVYDQARTAVAAAAVTRQQAPGLSQIRGALPVSNALGLFPGATESSTTSITFLLFEPDVGFSTQVRFAERYVERYFGPRDDVVGITGSVPARAAQGSTISDSLPMVELLTLLAITGIVGVAMRSLVAPLVALASAGVAFVMTLRLSGAFTSLLGVSSPSELEPVVVALLLGVVTDYVIFYLIALRAELRRGRSRLPAARAATTRFGPIVLVAGLAVAAGTGALLVAQSSFFRALGPALVFTVLVGLSVAVTLVPALLAVLGRVAFWPSRPDREPEPSAADHEPGRLDRLVAWLTASRRRALTVAGGATACLALLSLPVAGLGLSVSFVGSLPADTGIARAADAARQGFAPGALSPTTVLLEGEDLQAQRGELAALGARLEDAPGVAGVLGPGDLLPRLERNVLLRNDGSAARYLLVLDDPALGAAAISSLDDLRPQLPDLVAQSGLDPSTRVEVAGDTATAAYVVTQTTDDLVRLGVAALTANFVMLVIFLRAVVAALYLLVGSVLSLGTALGATIFVFDRIDPGAGLTFYVPFAAAVLLLAFGSDYNIFAVGSVWEEARRRPLREAIRVSMPSTISAIFVAGLALAASFGLLAVVPLVPFRELAFAMAVGIAVDVLVVRSVLLPTMLTVVGPLSAWPSTRLQDELAGGRHLAPRRAGPRRASRAAGRHRR